MRKIVAGLAMTLNGVVEGPSAEGGWLQFSPDMGEVISEGLASADAVLLGRRTYLEFEALWPAQGNSSPMAAFINSTPRYVLSNSLERLDWGGSTLLRGPLPEAVSGLKNQPGGDIMIPGSPALVGALAADGLLDELSLMVHPVLVGQGARLFQDLPGRASLELATSRVLSTGVLSLTYRRTAAPE